MKCIKITPTRTLNRDLDFLVKVPILPNRFWFEKHGYYICVHKPATEGEAYYIETNRDSFLKTYDEYYRNRFEVEHLETGYQVPSGHSVLVEYGKRSEEPPVSEKTSSKEKRETERESIS